MSSKNVFGGSFRYRTTSISSRVDYFSNNGLKVSEYNLISYPYKVMKQINYKKHDINSEKQLINFYHFKQTYISIVLKYILHVENSLKEALSYVVGVNYGDNTYVNNLRVDLANDYLNPINYSTSKNPEDVHKILLDLKKKIVKPPTYCNTIDKYKTRSNLPPYIVTEDLMLSAVIDWYYILKNDDSISVISFMLQKDISKMNSIEISLIRQFFLRSLRLLKETRNNYAHNNTAGTYTEDNYKGITFKSINLLFENDIFSLSISKNQYEQYVKKSPQSVSNICLLILLDNISKQKFIQEIMMLFEVDCKKKYHLSSSEIIDELNLNEFFTLIENVFYDYVEEDAAATA